MLVSYPWEVLTIGTLLYLASLPFGWISYRNYVRHAGEPAQAAAASANAGSGMIAETVAPPQKPADDVVPDGGERTTVVDLRPPRDATHAKKT